MLLAYVLIFLLHLSASTCYATSRIQPLLFAGRAADDTTALLPAAIHHHHHHHTAKAEVLSDYNDVRHYLPAVMERWGGGAPPPRQGKKDTSAAMEPSPSPLPSSSSVASAAEQEESASGDVGVHVDYYGPMKHPPSHN